MDAAADHLDSFITEADIGRIASWGLDHVRLPFDWSLLADEARPGSYSEEGFSRIDGCLRWCAAAGLALVLDLHHAPGQTYDLQRAENPLITEHANRERFLALWEEIARRYRGVGAELRFDILNEMVDPTGYGWNPLATEAIRRIRAVDPRRVLICGGNLYNSVHTLRELVPPDDPGVLCAFHFYEPTLFTHQRAYWADQTLRMAQTLEYPGSFPWLKAFLDGNPRLARDYAALAWERNDADYMRFLLGDAVKYKEATGRPLYCGEFGVIDAAPPASAERWTADLIGRLEERGIGWCLWTYKALDFGIMDAAGGIARPGLLSNVRRA